MTPKIKLDLSQAQRCAKEGCRKPGPFHRHHVRHKKYWINRWEEQSSGRIIFIDEDRWANFARRLEERYHRWLPRDLRNLCNWHHAEIHLLYQDIIHTELFFLKGRVTVKDAVRIMRKCRKFLKKWLGESSKGISPTRAGWKRKR